ncbi:isopentenyl-diphosphate Delta-isomerase [Niabella ginsengisoli]|uniref:Isopentenyl-diphosphate delta-isomerase n=1 Tax=Niabella ginsengisoli TaxID=522298 RepID=A0ABS9SN32_9BACT|nr:isopentenyl-diphosphate Delta-isomerase [Niabella ginsengisoli]MCH5599676.1 isopentenyl-diphosphate Delta-isomerase [Niabella ginsengisoli]
MALHNDFVILVDENDNAKGTMEKMEAHQKGLLHRAFSVLLFNDKKEWLLQQRALDKYHCGGLWTNTCCSHPFPDEDILHAAKRRLKEEMGIEGELDKAFDFIYKASFKNGLTEHEFDHVFIGQFSDTPNINTQEVADWKYISLSDLKEDLQLHPEKYTPWFKIIIDKM